MPRYTDYGIASHVLQMSPTNIALWLQADPAADGVIDTSVSQTRVVLRDPAAVAAALSSLDLAIEAVDRQNAKLTRRGRRPGGELKLARHELASLTDDHMTPVKWDSDKLKPWVDWRAAVAQAKRDGEPRPAIPAHDAATAREAAPQATQTAPHTVSMARRKKAADPDVKMPLFGDRRLTVDQTKQLIEDIRSGTRSMYGHDRQPLAPDAAQAFVARLSRLVKAADPKYRG